jgi:serine protease
MLDAAGAVTLATTGLYGRILSTPNPAIAAQSVTLSASSSLVAAGRSITSYSWSLTNGNGIVAGFAGSTNAATTSVVPTAAGSFTVSLTVVDNTNVRSTVTRTVAVSAVGTSTSTTNEGANPVSPTPTPGTTADTTDTGGGGGGALDATWLLLLTAAVVALGLTNRARSAGGAG